MDTDTAGHAEGIAPDLFRPEAVEYRAASLFGGLMIPSGQISALLGWGAAALSACLISVLFFGTYERKEHVPGYLAPEAGLVRVVSPRAGFVSGVDVVEGQRVGVGDPLFAVVAPRGAVSGEDAGQAQVDRLREQQAAIEAQFIAEQTLGSQREQVLRDRILSFRRQATGLLEQRDNAASRAELHLKEVSRLEKLGAAGHVAQSLLDERRVQMLEAEQGVQLLEREIERIESEVMSLQAELRQNPLQLSLRLEDLRYNLLTVKQALVEAEVQQAIVVRAPVAGRTTAVVANVGMSVSTGDPLLSLVPAGSELQAELLLPARVAGFVRAGQAVRLRYDAFPHQKFGLQRGTILSVSRTVLNPEDQNGPVRLQAPAYRVVATLHSQTIRAYGEELPLQPGLTLQADVIRDRRRILEWVFDPVLATVGRI